MTSHRSAGRTSWSMIAVIQVLLGMVALICISSARIPRAFWATDARTQAMLTLLAVAFVLLLLALLFGERRGRGATPVQVLLVGSLVTVPFLAAAHVFHPAFSRVALVLGPVLMVSCAWLIFALRGRTMLVTGLLAVLAGVGIALQAGKALGVGDKDKGPMRVVSHVASARYALKLTSFEGYIPRPATNQGGLTLFRDGYLLATGDGDVFFFKRSDNGEELAVDRWPIKVPINSAEFTAAAGNAVNLQWFRTADILALESTTGFRLFVTHHFWKSGQKCWVFRVSSLEGRYEDLGGSLAALDWKTVFESTPCVPLQTEFEPKKFEGLFNGGRMILLGPDELLVSIGDHGLEAPGYGLTDAASPGPCGFVWQDDPAPPE